MFLYCIRLLLATDDAFVSPCLLVILAQFCVLNLKHHTQVSGLLDEKLSQLVAAFRSRLAHLSDGTMAQLSWVSEANKACMVRHL